MVKKKDEKLTVATSDLGDLGRLLGFDDKTKNDESQLQFLKDTIPVFFKVDDKIGLSKTDIERFLVLPVSLLLDFGNNTLPTYNNYLKKYVIKKVLDKKLTEEEGKQFLEDKFISIPIISKFIEDIYIKTLISKDRKGRIEGTEISKALMELGKSVLANRNMGENMTKMVNDLQK